MKTNRTLLIVVLLVCAWASVTNAQPGKIKREYDRFKDATGVYIEPMMVLKDGLLGRNYNSVRLSAAFGYKGQVRNNIDTFLIMITSVSRGWRFEQDRGLIAIANGERLVLGTMDREASSSWDETFGMTVNNEELAVKVSADDFKKLAYASTVEMQVGYTDFKLKKEHLYALGQLAASAGLDSKFGLNSTWSQPAPSASLPPSSPASKETQARDEPSKAGPELTEKVTILEVETDQISYVGKAVSIFGNLEMSSYYFGAYRAAQATHYAFILRDKSGSSGKIAYVYMKRGEQADKLRKVLLDKQGHLEGWFTITILKVRFESNPSLIAEFVDYRPKS